MNCSLGIGLIDKGTRQRGSGFGISPGSGSRALWRYIRGCAAGGPVQRRNRPTDWSPGRVKVLPLEVAEKFFDRSGGK